MSEELEEHGGDPPEDHPSWALIGRTRAARGGGEPHPDRNRRQRHLHARADGVRRLPRQHRRVQRPDRPGRAGPRRRRQGRAAAPEAGNRRRRTPRRRHDRRHARRLHRRRNGRRLHSAADEAADRQEPGDRGRQVGRAEQQPGRGDAARPQRVGQGPPGQRLRGRLRPGRLRNVAERLRGKPLRRPAAGADAQRDRQSAAGQPRRTQRVRGNEPRHRAAGEQPRGPAAGLARRGGPRPALPRLHRPAPGATASGCSPPRRPAPLNKQLSFDHGAHAEVEATVARLDIPFEALWRPGLDRFWTQMRKGEMLAIARRTLGPEWAAAHGKDKKDELADAMAAAFGRDGEAREPGPERGRAGRRAGLDPVRIPGVRPGPPAGGGREHTATATPGSPSRPGRRSTTATPKSTPKRWPGPPRPPTRKAPAARNPPPPTRSTEPSCSTRSPRRTTVTGCPRTTSTTTPGPATRRHRSITDRPTSFRRSCRSRKRPRSARADQPKSELYAHFAVPAPRTRGSTIVQSGVGVSSKSPLPRAHE